MFFVVSCTAPVASGPAPTPSAEASSAAELTERQALTSIEIAGHRLQVELAITPEEQSKGLMHRTSMPENQGMLFVFSPSKQTGMWMKNTPLPLSVAFIDEQNTIVAIKEMHPNTSDLHIAPQPVRYALETHQGWFAERGISVGTRVNISDEQAILAHAQP